MDGDFRLLDDDFEYALAPAYEATSRKPFPLLALPPELWIRICRMAATTSAPVTEVTRAMGLRDQQEMVRQPAITQTCRLIRHETLAHFYQTSTFILQHNAAKCTRFWLQAIGLENRKAIGTLTISCGHDEEFWRGCFERAGMYGKITAHDEILTIKFS